MLQVKHQGSQSIQRCDYGKKRKNPTKLCLPFLFWSNIQVLVTRDPQICPVLVRKQDVLAGTLSDSKNEQWTKDFQATQTNTSQNHKDFVSFVKLKNIKNLN